jgi:hypothetical protein
MKVSINFTHHFETKYKWYKKKFKSLESDIDEFTKNLTQFSSDDLGNGIHKYRLAVKSKNTGKRGGFRVISFEVLASLCEKEVTLITLYDKGEQSSISKKEIVAILKEEGLV